MCHGVCRLGTNTGTADEEARAWLATDWLVRVQTAAWLDLAKLSDAAVRLRELPPLTSTEIATACQSVIGSVQQEAAAARAAARDAVRAAAGAAAGDALRPTVIALQESAFDLLDRMIAVGRVPEPEMLLDRVAILRP